MWAIFAAILALAAGMIFIPVEGDIPGYAMDSAFLFRLERTLAIATLLIVPSLVIGPLLTGALPQKLSSDGIDWGDDRANVVDTLDSVNKRLNTLETALAKIAEINRE